MSLHEAIIKEIEEEVSNGFAIDDLDLNFMTVVNRRHFNWLLEQAELVQEYKEELLELSKELEVKQLNIKDNPKEVVRAIEQGEIELADVDPDFHQEEYVDGLGDLLIVHKLDEETEVFFEEHDYVKEEREKFYNGEITDVEFNDFIANLNDLEGQFDYNKVVAYRVYGKPMEFVSDFKKENEVELDM